MLTTTIDLTATDLRSMKTVELRKLAGQVGLKGQSSARKEHLLGLLEPIKLAQEEAKEEAAKVEEAPAPKKSGRSRAGMVIVAKGSEVHKSEIFRKAAEAAGWTVEMQRETYELEDDAEGEGTRYYATATRGNDSISLAWDGRAYDYPSSSATINGKGRKIRNLKEALRVL
jgi:hypothetical protein